MDNIDQVVAADLTVPAEIAKALIEVQKEIKSIEKSAENAHFKNTYAPLDAVMDYILPIASKHGLIWMQWPISMGDKHFLHSVLAHESGVSMQTNTELLLQKKDPQGLGSALTYERRQTTMSTFGLSAKDEDDDGNKASGHLPPPTQQQLDEIAAICASLKFPPEDVAKKLKNLRSADQALIALDDLDKIIQGRAAGIKARKATESVEIEVKDDSETKPTARAEEVADHIMRLNLRPEKASELIKLHTKRDRLEQAKPWELKVLDGALDRIESGEEQLPLDWFNAEVTPPEEVA
jgi:hypothetical protein